MIGLKVNNSGSLAKTVSIIRKFHKNLSISEIKQKIDFSECVIRLKKYPDVVYSNNSRVVGEGFFEGKVKNKRGTFYYEITLQCSNRRLKDKSAWEVRKLAIHVAGDTKPFFISGKEAPK